MEGHEQKAVEKRENSSKVTLGRLSRVEDNVVSVLQDRASLPERTCRAERGSQEGTPDPEKSTSTAWRNWASSCVQRIPSSSSSLLAGQVTSH